MPPSDESVRGTLFGAAAFAWWGVIPAYYKLVEHIPSPELVAHRVVWIVMFNVAALGVIGRVDRYTRVWRDRTLLKRLGLSAAMLSCNWLVFLWAATHDRLLEVSMGYFIAPLVHVMLGVVVLGERLRRMQGLALGIAALGVAYLIVEYGAVPWVALVLPATFGVYGLIRKHTDVDSIAGLTVEMTLAFPVALVAIVVYATSGAGHFGSGHGTDNVFLVLNGPITIVPLTLFAAATRRVRLTTIGFLQYIGPSLTFLLAVFVYREAFDWARAAAFMCIWLSLAIYTIDGVRFSRTGASAPLDPVTE